MSTAATTAATPTAAATPAATPATTPAAPAPTPDATAPADAAAPPKADAMAPKFAALAAAERRLHAQKAEIKAAMAEVEAYKADQALKQSDPVAWLQKQGVDYTDLTGRIIQGNAKPTVESRLEQLERERNEAREQAAVAQREASSREEQQRLHAFRGDLEKFVGANAATYELVQAQGAHDLVQNVIAEYAAETARTSGRPQLLAFEDACKIVEEHLQEEALKLASHQKVQRILQERAAKAADAAKAVPQRTATSAGHSANTGPKTLTNSLSATGAVVEPERLDPDVKLARLIARLG